MFLDIVCISQMNTNLRLKGLLPTAQYTEERLLDFFPRAATFLHELGPRAAHGGVAAYLAVGETGNNSSNRQ